MSPFLLLEQCLGRLKASEARISFSWRWVLEPKQASFLTRLGGSRCTGLLPKACLGWSECGSRPGQEVEQTQGCLPDLGDQRRGSGLTRWSGGSDGMCGLLDGPYQLLQVHHRGREMRLDRYAPEPSVSCSAEPMMGLLYPEHPLYDRAPQLEFTQTAFGAAELSCPFHVATRIEGEPPRRILPLAHDTAASR